MKGRIILALTTAWPSLALAQTDTGHVLDQLTAMMPLLVAIATMIGLILFGMGIYRVYKHGSNAQQYPISTSLKLLASGTLLLSLLTTYQIITVSTVDSDWNGSNRSILALDDQALDSMDNVDNSSILGKMMPSGMGPIVIGFVYLIGFVAFVKGLYSIKDVGNQQAQSGGMGKVLTHIIGGVVAMNIIPSACILSSIFTQGGASFCT